MRIMKPGLCIFGVVEASSVVSRCWQSNVAGWVLMAIPNNNLELPNMSIPLESHLTLFNTPVDCIVNPLPLEDLLIVGHSDKKVKALEEEAMGGLVNYQLPSGLSPDSKENWQGAASQLASSLNLPSRS
jgi:hypothetical protein